MEPKDLFVEAREYPRFNVSNHVDIIKHLDEYGFVIISQVADQAQVKNTEIHIIRKY